MEETAEQDAVTNNIAEAPEYNIRHFKLRIVHCLIVYIFNFIKYTSA